MPDVNTPERKQQEILLRSIDNFRAQGRHVMACFQGSTVVSVETFADARDMVDAANLTHRQITRVQCWTPSN